MDEGKKTYVCLDKDGNTPITDLYVFTVAPTNKYNITQNPTEKGVVRQDNKVKLPPEITVEAYAYCNTGTDTAGSIPASRDWEDFFLGDPYSMFSVKDGGRIFKNLSVENFSCKHDSQLPDLVELEISFIQILDAGELTNGASGGGTAPSTPASNDGGSTGTSGDTSTTE
jgi:hypothetical protein